MNTDKLSEQVSKEFLKTYNLATTKASGAKEVM